MKDFIDIVINKEKMINEIQKLLFDKSFYARHLSAHGFKIDTAVKHLKNYLDWRKKQNIDTILVSTKFQYINQFCYMVGLWIPVIREDQGSLPQWLPLLR